MAINALVELAPHDARVREVLGAHINAMRSSLVKTVTAAQEHGQISRTRSAELITAIIITFMSGIGTQLKGAMTKAEAHDLMDAQLQALM
jgi:Flp pilus assembly pilin Flp